MKYRAIEGVNLGGWLVLEPWMTPSVFEGFDAKDEYSLWQHLDARKRIEKHRKTFMTEKDWQWLADHNVKYVRLPVGYWVLDDDTPFVNARNHLDWAFEMAEKYEINILLDLHALKGSQNGEMHSGRMGKVAWKKYMADHLRVLNALAIRYTDSPAFWALEIINEPRVWGNYFALLSYYRKAYRELCRVLNPTTAVIFHDGFLPPLFSGALTIRRNHPVLMDTHFYLILPKLLENMTPEKYDSVRGVLYRFLIWLVQFAQPVIVGEWSSVLPQKFFDRIPEKDHVTLLGETIARQRKMYQGSFATFYWNYKTEGRGMYNYRSLIEDKIIDS